TPSHRRDVHFGPLLSLTSWLSVTVNQSTNSVPGGAGERRGRRGNLHNFPRGRRRGALACITPALRGLRATWNLSSDVRRPGECEPGRDHRGDSRLRCLPGIHGDSGGSCSHEHRWGSSRNSGGARRTLSWPNPEVPSWHTDPAASSHPEGGPGAAVRLRRRSRRSSALVTMMPTMSSACRRITSQLR